MGFIYLKTSFEKIIEKALCELGPSGEHGWKFSNELFRRVKDYFVLREPCLDKDYEDVRRDCVFAVDNLDPISDSETAKREIFGRNYRDNLESFGRYYRIFSDVDPQNYNLEDNELIIVKHENERWSASMLTQLVNDYFVSEVFEIGEKAASFKLRNNRFSLELDEDIDVWVPDNANKLYLEGGIYFNGNEEHVAEIMKDTIDAAMNYAAEVGELCFGEE